VRGTRVGAREERVASIDLDRDLLEVLAVPFRDGDAHLAERYEQLITRSRGVRVMDVTRGALRANPREQGGFDDDV